MSLLGNNFENIVVEVRISLITKLKHTIGGKRPSWHFSIFIFRSMTNVSGEGRAVKLSLHAHTNTAHHHHITQELDLFRVRSAGSDWEVVSTDYCTGERLSIVVSTDITALVKR